MADFEHIDLQLTQKGEKKRLSAPGVNYMGPEKGPFHCGGCEYFKNGFCTYDKRGDMSVPEEARVAILAHVDPDGCCNLYSPEDEEE